MTLRGFVQNGECKKMIRIFPTGGAVFVILRCRADTADLMSEKRKEKT